LNDVQQFHQYQQKSPLTSTHWVMVNNSTNINQNHLSLQLIEWWSTIPPISTKITSHLNSLNDGQQFHQYQQKSPLTTTHWVMVNLLILVELFTITQSVKMRGDFYWYWWNCWPSLNELRWEVMFVDIGGIVDHHSMSWGERWFLLILVELLTITQWVEVRGDFLIEWWSTIPPISTKITSHLNSLSDGQQFHQYQQKSPLTSTHWVMVNNSTNINKNHLSPQLIEWWSTIPPISANITSHLNSLSDVNNSTKINKNHLSP
jgi:predicted secreted protein